MTAAFGFCGGGTGGHIFPALAVVRALQKLQPEAAIAYFGKSTGMESRIVPQQGLAFYGLEVTGLSRSLSVGNLKTLWQAGMAYGTARKILKQLRINAVLGTGGFVCGPVITAAASLRIPSVIHESNAVPGLTNRLLGSLASKVAVSHTITARYFDENKIVHTGFPLREGLSATRTEALYSQFGLTPDKITVFIFPGSLAARKINKTIIDLVPQLKNSLPQVQFLWMTGKADFAWVNKACETQGLAASVHEFIDDVPAALAITDLVIARAGAGTVAEISATGKPAILVPYPYATGDHQTKNAMILQKAGMARMVKDGQLHGKLLFSELRRMLDHLDALTECAEVWKHHYPKDAAHQLAQLMVELGERKK